MQHSHVGETHQSDTHSEAALSLILSDLLCAAGLSQRKGSDIPDIHSAIIGSASKVFSVFAQGNSPDLASFYVICD